MESEILYTSREVEQQIMEIEGALIRITMSPRVYFDRPYSDMFQSKLEPYSDKALDARLRKYLGETITKTNLREFSVDVLKRPTQTSVVTEGS